MSAEQARLIQLAQDGAAAAIAELLAAEEAPELEFVDESGLSPLMYAAQVDDSAVVSALLDGARRHADINYQSPKDGSTALFVAAFYGSLDCIELLIRRGSDLSIRDSAGRLVTDLTETHSESATDARAVQAAIYSAQAAIANPRPETPEEEEEELSPASKSLLSASFDGDLAGVQAALEDGALIDSVGSDGLSALMVAARGGHLDLVRHLVVDGIADVDLSDRRSGGVTALQLAVRHGQSDVIVWLIAQAGASVEITNEDGEAAHSIQPQERLTKGQVDELIEEGLRQRAKRQAQEQAEADADDQQEQNDDVNESTAVDADGEVGGVDGAEPSDVAGASEDVAPDESRLQSDSTLEPSNEVDESDEKYPVASGDDMPAQQFSSPADDFQSSPPAAAAPTRPPPQFDSRDARAFLELSMPQALALVIQRYKSCCIDFGQDASPYIIAGVQNIAYPGQALLLSGSSAGTATTRLTDQELYPLLEILTYSFPTCPLATLDASFNHLGRTSASGLAMLLNVCHSLTSIDLSGNDLDRSAGESLADVLLDPSCSLVRLNLHTNPIGPYAIAKFAHVLTVNTKLIELNIGNTDCETLSLMKIGTALQTNRTLKRLNIDSPLIYSCQEETTIHLARCLALNTGLVSLSMKGHALTDSGAEWLCEYLRPNRYITDLNLARNKLTTTGVAGFVDAIAHRPVECIINLDGNILTGQRFDEIQQQIDTMKANHARNTIVWLSKQDKHSLRAKAPL